MTNMNYTIKKLDNDTYCINDDDMCTTYVIIGAKKALVIDCGYLNDLSLKNEILKITNKELIVALTHSHYDHIGHLNEFANFYVAKEELNEIKDESLKKKAIIINDNHTFDLGDKKIIAKIYQGHTKASTIFFDINNKNVFTGDQFGSGCGVWMQVKQASCLSTYIKEIDRFLNYLDSFGFKFNFYGGHLGQEYTSRIGKYNPLNKELVINLKILSQKLLNNEIELQDCNATMFTNEKSYYAVYETAEMIIRKSLIK